MPQKMSYPPRPHTRCTHTADKHTTHGIGSTLTTHCLLHGRRRPQHPTKHASVLFLFLSSSAQG